METHENTVTEYARFGGAGRDDMPERDANRRPELDEIGSSLRQQAPSQRNEKKGERRRRILCRLDVDRGLSWAATQGGLHCRVDSQPITAAGCLATQTEPPQHGNPIGPAASADRQIQPLSFSGSQRPPLPARQPTSPLQQPETRNTLKGRSNHANKTIFWPG